jgi:hypothetical protein
MLTFITSLFTGLVGKWILRRFMELGGLAFAVSQIIGALPPQTQATLYSLITGRLDEISVTALIGLGVAVWGYVWSFRSTVKPQIVAGNQQVPIKDLPVLTREQVKDIVQAETGVRPEIIEKPTR